MASLGPDWPSAVVQNTQQITQHGLRDSATVGRYAAFAVDVPLRGLGLLPEPPRSARTRRR
jgi:hypothetical protein